MAEGTDGYQLNLNRIAQGVEADEACESCEVCVTTNCQSCGMPMTCPQEHGGGDKENQYCVRCCHADGSLKNFEEVLEGMASFMMDSRKMDKDSAERAAREFLAMMPAWAGQ